VDAKHQRREYGKAAACAARDPPTAKSHDCKEPRHRVAEQQDEQPSCHKGEHVVWMRQPTAKAISIIRTTTNTLRDRSASVLPGEHRPSGHRQCVESLHQTTLHVRRPTMAVAIDRYLFPFLGWDCYISQMFASPLVTSTESARRIP
jgi:hypothetical protein